MKPRRLIAVVRLSKSVVHAYQRRTQGGGTVQVGEYTNKVQKKPEQAGPPLGHSLGMTSSGKNIFAQSHRSHEAWSAADHWEAANVHRQHATQARESMDHKTAEAHSARAVYHQKIAQGDSNGAAAVAQYDHRFSQHLQGHQSAEHPARTATEKQGIESETTVPPTAGKPYAPDPTADQNGDGIPDASRVGVPAFSTPPPPPVMPRLPNLTAEERRVEDRFAKHFEADPDGAAQAYLDKLQSREIGDAPNVFNTDDVKLLSPDYNPQGVSQDETFDARSKYNVSVHQTANAIAKRAFVKYLDSVVKDLPEDKRTVLVTSGGVASGKGYAIGQVQSVNDIAQSVGAVWDAAGEQNATENPWILDQCRSRGIKPVFVFVHADPKQTWENPKRGVIERAQKKGRMVDARLFAESYAVGAKNFQAFYEKNKDDQDASFIFLENVSQPQLLDEFPQDALNFDGEELYARCSQHLEALQGIKDSVKRGGSIGKRIWGPPQKAQRASPEVARQSAA